MEKEQLKISLTEIIKSHKSINDRLQEICNKLHSEISYFDWVGFYFADANKKELHLGPFAGLPTDHTTIPFGKGICGQVAESNQTFLVDDVQAQDNYISCNIHVKSEIVVPIIVNGNNIGQIDIDSNTLNAFTAEDQAFLEWLTNEIAEMYKS
ncbi:GAF domain-containing protein [Paenimyroides aestuarii]|uniref:GAF domain-containing protein n=1 Tax=Paenimyroides aestuarii TaxID=2968490 RepID=A0ABY5NTP4_9FLAO|nr:GAF domain-containing protein [Paenimyroides aestuarii]UUV21951.1 GAF domain-containing protein [Paenimyroides aestuarii]